MGLGLFTIVLNSQLRRLRLPVPAFEDDFKFVIDVEHHSLAEVQDDLAPINDWLNTHLMPLTIKKSLVLHCGVGVHNPNRIYNAAGEDLAKQ